ncbi:MAG: glycoside hydrolase family 92 protein, partial [Clostridia bacterium]|nr:glycoside hydrolase family 92 protein [Clostridia bacterium]
MNKRTPAEYVNPYIGTIGHLLTATRPATALPHGGVQVFPVVTPNMQDYFIAEKIASFPLCTLGVMFADENADAFESAVSRFDMSAVKSHPYSYSVYLEDSDIDVSGSASQHGCVYKVSGAKKLFIRAGHHAAVGEENGVLLIERKESRNAARKSWTLVKLSCDFTAETADGTIVITPADRDFEISAAVSYISADKAKEIYAIELDGKTYETVAAEAKAVWEDLLGRVKVRGGSEDLKAAYYTALYRSFGKMTDFSEYGQYYSGYDGKVHDGEFYTVDQLWDNFRSMHPLQLLLEPERHKAMLDSYVKMYKQSGAMPSFPSKDGDAPVMIGFHAASLFADGLAKGIEADYETAYEGMRRNATEITMLPWVGDKPANELDRCYYEKGFFPSLEIGQEEWIEDAHSFERRQCLAVTLEHAYDDWCVAQVAKHLGKDADYELFM